MLHCVWRCLFTTGTGKFTEIEGKIDGCRKTCRKRCSPQRTCTWKTIHLPADQDTELKPVVWLQIQKALSIDKSHTAIHLKYCSQIFPIQLAKSNFDKKKKCQHDDSRHAIRIYTKRHIDASKGRVQQAKDVTR